MFEKPGSEHFEGVGGRLLLNNKNFQQLREKQKRKIGQCYVLRKCPTETR